MKATVKVSKKVLNRVKDSIKEEYGSVAEFFEYILRLTDLLGVDFWKHGKRENIEQRKKEFVKTLITIQGKLDLIIQEEDCDQRVKMLLELYDYIGEVIDRYMNEYYQKEGE